MDSKKRRSDRCTRAQLRSPGRPPVASRHERELFWRYVAAGMGSEAAAVEAGASQLVGSRWFREAGGMPRRYSGARPSPCRADICRWRNGKRSRCCWCRGMASARSRAGSAVRRRPSRARSGAMPPRVVRNLDYRATTAQWHAERAARRPKVARLVANSTLRSWGKERLSGAVARPGAPPVIGPAIRWKGRQYGTRQHRRWSKA